MSTFESILLHSINNRSRCGSSPPSLLLPWSAVISAISLSPLIFWKIGYAPWFGSHHEPWPWDRLGLSFPFLICLYLSRSCWWSGVGTHGIYLRLGSSRGWRWWDHGCHSQLLVRSRSLSFPHQLRRWWPTGMHDGPVCTQFCKKSNRSQKQRPSTTSRLVWMSSFKSSPHPFLFI